MSEPKELKCKDVLNHICEHLGEDLESPRCVAIKQHLNECTCCKTYFKTMETTIQFYKDYNVNIGPGEHDRLLDKLGLSDCDEKK